MIVYGIALRREEVTPHWMPWTLIAGGVLAIPMGFWSSPRSNGILLTILGAMALALLGLQTSRRVHALATTDL